MCASSVNPLSATPSVDWVERYPEIAHPNSENRQLEQRVDKFLAEWQNQGDCKSDVPSSQVLSVFEHKIRLLQSREDVLEASIQANTEALSQAHRLCEHYRQRALLAESESNQLRPLHLEVISKLEASKRSVSIHMDRLQQQAVELANVRSQLSQKQEECEDLARKNEGLQAKLAAAREQNRAMDATIDDYRSQLDQAKEQIQAQALQINKFTQITKLINDLTGNPPADATTSIAQHNLSTSVADCPSDRGSVTNAGTSDARNTTGGPPRKVVARSSRR